jgi:hypothetical protein
MTRVLQRLTRGVCPAAERPWLDALFAEMEAIESGRARLLWLLGAAGLLADGYTRLIAIVVTPASLTLLSGAFVLGCMALIELEGLLPEDDWYGPLAALCTAGLIGVAVLNLRRPSRSSWP